MDYPVPRHLREIFTADEEQSSMDSVLGYIVCPCGCDSFALKAYCTENADGTVSCRDDIEDGKLITDTPFEGRRWAFALRAVCKECGKDHLIADLSKLGYDGIICEDFRPVESWELKPYHCAKCSGNNFLLRLFFEAFDKEQFIEEIVAEMPDRFAPEDHVDAVMWFCADIKCADCGHYVNNWFDIDLSL